MQSKILGIESSCDESALSYITAQYNGTYKVEIHKELVATHDHSSYGGVVPESASRQHFFFLPKMLEKCQHFLPDIDCIAAACGPGLMGGLMLGATLGKSISLATNKPFYPVDHIKAHILSPLIENPTLTFPYICLLVSGGHTMLVEIHSFSQLKVLARTQDDAMGEFFDKIANYLGYGFPGGRIIEQKAAYGNPDRFVFTLPKIKANNANFSFSGLKTAFIQQIDKIHPLTEQDKHDICASLQKTVQRICIQKLKALFENNPIKQYCVAGGVGANKLIRGSLDELAKKYDKQIFYPSLTLCTDNATMIAFAGFVGQVSGEQPNLLAKTYSSLAW